MLAFLLFLTLCLLGVIYYEIARAVERAWEDAVTRVPAATKSPVEKWAERPIGM